MLAFGGHNIMMNCLSLFPFFGKLNMCGEVGELVDLIVNVGQGFKHPFDTCKVFNLGGVWIGFF